MAEQSGTERVRDRHQAAAYVAELTGELALVARRHGLDALGYLLEMAQLEAKNAAQRSRTAAGKPKITRNQKQFTGS
jgi:hypothetical protein